MPWVVGDVERHKHGLTDKQKRQWVQVANSALASCLAEGRDQSECEGSAIRQANSVAGGKAMEDDRTDELKAVWATAAVNNFPDGSFLYIEPGGEKDEGGKTVPRSLRHFPVKDAGGAVDLPHVRNALSRLGQPDTGSNWKTPLTATLRKTLITKAQGLLKGGKALGEEAEIDDKDEGVTDDIANKPDTKAFGDDALITCGGTVKMTRDGHFEGPLVRFTSQDELDLEGEFFTSETDFDIEDGVVSSTYYHHGADPVLRRRRIGKATLVKDEVQIWAEGQLDLRDKWERAVRDLGLAGRLGLSSGTAPHLVEKEKRTKGVWIKRWPLGLDVSLTPTPAEVGNIVTMKSYRAMDVPSLKAYLPEEPVEDKTVSADADEARPEPIKTATKSVARRAVMKIIESGGMFHVMKTEDGDIVGAPVKSFDSGDKAQGYINDLGKPPELQMWERFMAAQNATMEKMLDLATKAMQPGRKGMALTGELGDSEVTFAKFVNGVAKDDRVALDAMGSKWVEMKQLSETTGPSGGYLVPTPVLAEEFIQVAGEDEIVYGRADVQPVKGPVALPGLATTGSTPGRSNFYGGVAGGWVESGQCKPLVDMDFYMAELHPWEYAGYLPVADQLLRRSVINLPALLTKIFRAAVGFYRDEAFLDGTGAGQPQGMIGAPGTFRQPRQTAGTITYTDLVRMKNHFLPSSWTKGHWVFNISCYEILRLITDPAGHYIWAENAWGGEPPTVLGLPYVFTEKTPTIGTMGDVLLADESWYYIADEMTFALSKSEHVLFTQNRTVFKFFITVDGQEKLPLPIFLKDGTFEVSPFVVLSGALTT